MMKKEKNVYKGKLLDVYQQKQTLPNGIVANLEIIKHPGAALIVPFLSVNKVVMVKQYRPVFGQYIYELPAGKLEGNEKPHICARREVIEETGYRASKITRIGEIYPVPGYSTEKIIFYKAEGLTQVPRNLDHDEIMDVCIMTKKEVKELFKKGMLVDAKTICAFAMCGWL